MSHEDLQQLSLQLARLPGGAAAAVPDFFARLLVDDLAPLTSEWDITGWSLQAGGVLMLRTDPASECLHLCHCTAEDDLQIAVLPRALLDVAREDGLSPIVLGLLAIAAGQIDDGRRLKARLPGVDGAAKDLMLMTVCRLCG